MRDSEEQALGYSDQLSGTNSTVLKRLVKRPQGSKDYGVNSIGILHPEGRFIKTWHEILLASCVLAVFVDPFFYYLPVINARNTCVLLDKRLKVVAICLRLITDMIYLLNIFLQFLCPYKTEDHRDIGRTRLVTEPRAIRNKYLLSYFVVDVLAILPIPQVVIPITFSEKKGLNSLNQRKLLNALTLFQYVPRIVRIYLTWRKLNETSNRIQKSIHVKAALNLFLYILGSHVLGAFWYFFSIEREMACWYLACGKHNGCKLPTSFTCDDHGFANYTILNDDCPVQTPNTTLFDFGIFLEALQSDTVSSMDFLRKIMYCFWWGLRNLSSLGQNLQSSPYFWENCFTVTISICGLLLFLYFIGNLQMYMQFKTSRQLKTFKDKKEMAKIKAKEQSIELWINRNGLNYGNLKKDIMFHIGQRLEEKEDVNVDNPFDLLPIFLRREIKNYLSLPLLEKVPMFQNGRQNYTKLLVCEYLKHMYYHEDTYIIREGEPLDRMLLITEGVVWKSASSSGGIVSSSWVCLEKGQFCGEQLLEWAGFNDTNPSCLLLSKDTSHSPSLSNLPVSPMTLKTHTKVEAFVLMANDLKRLLRRNFEAPSASQAASAIQTAWRRSNQLQHWRRK
ncbi:Cyclic nucleotide-gated ion channel 1 [Morella rubra]|uniref:Cyclic nucleotide-gated ion channel 1 n=1 Tax=Morella rubra TaxID=262757 RepID=A0A6A1UYY9_9ROSI|nr:Cyclic nucleotide-gated ion channel 1 [Morella rubra]